MERKIKTAQEIKNRFIVATAKFFAQDKTNRSVKSNFEGDDSSDFRWAKFYQQAIAKTVVEYGPCLFQLSNFKSLWKSASPRNAYQHFRGANHFVQLEMP
jgi:hypothetical protein